MATGRAVPLLTFSDNKDGTGAVATVAGADTYTNNEIFVQRLAPRMDSVFRSMGSVGDNGTLVISLPCGIYASYTVSGPARWSSARVAWASAAFKWSANGGTAQTGISYFGVSSNPLAVQEQCLLAVTAGVSTLANAGVLPGITTSDIITPDQVTEQFVLNPEQIKSIPGIVVCLPAGVSETEGRGTNMRDDISYPVSILIVDNNDGNYVPDRPAFVLLRERFYRYFRHQRLQSAVPTVYNVEVQPGSIVRADTLKINWLVSELIVRCYSREPRGI